MSAGQPKLLFSKAQFIKSCSQVEQLPPDEGKEIAFVGRSNSGKSSVINCLCAQKTLARTSKTPGRTQLINIFEMLPGYRVIDLPGYGFAKVSRSVSRDWRILLEDYIEQRRSLVGIVIIMDIRHPLTEFDFLMIDWLESQGRHLHLLLNKSDKLTYGACKQTEMQVSQIMDKTYTMDYSVQAFSAHKKIGLEPLNELLMGWLLGS